MAPYERFAAWREWHTLAHRVYDATERFPKWEIYGLTSQARRAAFSAAVNIVEGSSRRGSAEFRRFLNFSLSSLTELGYALRFSMERGYLTKEQWVELDRHQGRARFLTWKLYEAIGSKKR